MYVTKNTENEHEVLLSCQDKEIFHVLFVTWDMHGHIYCVYFICQKSFTDKGMCSPTQ